MRPLAIARPCPRVGEPDEEADAAPGMADDTLVPCQFVTETAHSPEQRLWLAVLLAAMRAITFVRARRWREAEGDAAWVASEEEQPQSFRWVCEALQIEPSVVRRWLQHPPALRNDLLQIRVHGERPRRQERA